LHQTIAEGETRENKLVRTDAQGKARFSNLKTATDYSYRVSVRRGPATYAAAPFQFRNDMGQNVTLHLFPVTQDIQKALLGMRGIVAVETRDDVFQFEVLFRIFNIGSVTWVPSNVVLELPAASKGITAQEGMTDTRFVTEGDRRVRLVGTFGPGQHDLTFRFQVTKDDASRAQFHLTLPPHVASMRVIAQSAPGMELFVDGFDPAEPTLDSNGQHLLITDKQLRAGEPQLKELSLILSGLPTPGPGRWIAVALAAGLFVSGVAAAARSSEQPRKLDLEQVENARQLLITELVALQKARNSEQIGPATYEATRRRLFEALARLQLSRATETAVKPKSARLKTAAPNPS
jgi:hypothetical protein